MTTQAEKAWAAGLFEGEGSCLVGGSGNRQPRVQMVMTDREPITRFQRIVGCGQVASYPSYSGHKPTWRWNVQGQEDVLAVLALLWPWLSPRRQEQAAEVIERASKMNDGRGYCKRGHDLSDPVHLYVHKKTGKRHCRTCRIAQTTEWKRRGRVSRPVA